MKKYLILAVLVIKVWSVYQLIRLHILPNVWYKCELDLAEIKAKRMAQWFKDNNNYNLKLNNQLPTSE